MNVCMYDLPPLSCSSSTAHNVENRPHTHIQHAYICLCIHVQISTLEDLAKALSTPSLVAHTQDGEKVSRSSLLSLFHARPLLLRYNDVSVKVSKEASDSSMVTGAQLFKLAERVHDSEGGFVSEEQLNKFADEVRCVTITCLALLRAFIMCVCMLSTLCCIVLSNPISLGTDRPRDSHLASPSHHDENTLSSSSPPPAPSAPSSSLPCKQLGFADVSAARNALVSSGLVHAITTTADGAPATSPTAVYLSTHANRSTATLLHNSASYASCIAALEKQLQDLHTRNVAMGNALSIIESKVRRTGLIKKTFVTTWLTGQFVFLFWLVFDVFSWDVMEPASYFITLAYSVAYCAYFAATKKSPGE